MKKYLLLLSILLLTGCTSSYDLNIINNSFNEKITVTYKENELSNEELSTLPHSTKEKTKAFYIGNDDLFLNKSLKTKGKKNTLTVSYNYDNTNFDNAYLINSCFDEHIFINEDDYYYIDLIGDFHCNYDRDITINITTNYTVTDTNATYNNGKYSWTITNDNNKDLDLYIDILKVEKENDYKGFSIFRIVGLIVLLILSIVAYLLYRKYNKNN